MLDNANFKLPYVCSDFCYSTSVMTMTEGRLRLPTYYGLWYESYQIRTIAGLFES